MSEYKVETGIAIAPRKYAGRKYPFGTMSIGDSFALKDDSHSEYTRVNASARSFAKEHPPMKFSIRIEKFTGQRRCWRIA